MWLLAMSMGVAVHSPLSLISDFKMLAGMRPEEGRVVAVSHPHEALGAQDRLQRRVSRGGSQIPGGLVVADRNPLQHRLPQPVPTSKALMLGMCSSNALLASVGRSLQGCIELIINRVICWKQWREALGGSATFA